MEYLLTLLTARVVASLTALHAAEPVAIPNALPSRAKASRWASRIAPSLMRLEIDHGHVIPEGRA